MTRRTGEWRTLRTGAVIVAALLLCGEARAQSSGGGGPFSFFDNIFTGSLSKGSQTAPPAQRPELGAGARREQRAAALERRGRRLRPSPDDRERDPRGGGEFRQLRRLDVARRRTPQHLAGKASSASPQGLTPDLRIMDLMDSQPEFTKSIWDYLDILVNDNRLAKGREILAKYKPQFDAAEKAYGVDRYAIAAIWGIESNYSTQMGDRSVLQSTATLACIGRRQKYFRDEFLSALEILHHGDLRPEQMRGSWAGAFGPTQFMPTAFKRYAVDADGDGRRDVVDDPADLIASTANNLKKDGWQTGQTWGFEVVVPPGFNYMLADRAKAMTMAQWEHLGLKRAGGQPFPHPAEKAYLLAPAGAEGPGFLMLQNFRVIMKYNPAEAYALAIGHFADRLRGGAPFVQPWPRQERELSRAERLELQQLLAQRGFYRGTPDGQFGGQTRDALRSFQASIGAAADGFASSDVLERLRGR